MEVLILRGIPGSGKSTWARNFIKDNSESWIIVNRDSIRDMLGNYWIPARERLVYNIEHRMISESLKEKFNVIVDATNLDKNVIGGIEVLVELFNYDSNITATIEFKDFEVDLDIAIERDKGRDRTVGEDVIKEFYNKYKNE